MPAWVPHRHVACSARGVPDPAPGMNSLRSLPLPAPAPPRRVRMTRCIRWRNGGIVGSARAGGEMIQVPALILLRNRLSSSPLLAGVRGPHASRLGLSAKLLIMRGDRGAVSCPPVILGLDLRIQQQAMLGLGGTASRCPFSPPRPIPRLCPDPPPRKDTAWTAPTTQASSKWSC